ncbi:DUF4179 domain-containing protein [Clostridium sp. HMP27]|uniref:DUF4179 domain-containing protein n=1 Tax=Clostridium sp. HMP27 TaxID=1487921 RepID=UPI00052CD490|nr:DUF4179 domain-containing protein [Clostridium sp. HMP27]KGK85816.1 hypothetical protein DP68_15750 [Clostridium sp. HMP27]
MNKIEEILKGKKLQIEGLEVPNELEERLRGTLDKVEIKRKNKSKLIVKIASLIIAVLLIGYNGDTLAFYGKKLIGFDEVMTDTLKDLNDMGKGQIIDKSYTFKNGVKVTLDGIMLDDNQLLMFYTIKDPKGNVDKIDIEHNPYIKGLVGTYHMGNGEGRRNEENTEIRWKAQYDTPYFFEKTLDWRFTLAEGNERENGEIKFVLDRNKAMGSSLKKTLNKSIKIDQGEIDFHSIVASPTTTYINGEIQSLFELAKDELLGEGFRPAELDIRLIANGEEVQMQSAGMSTDMKGITFNNNFDALPKELKTLQIKLVSFGSNSRVNEKMELSKDQKDKVVQILGQNVKINDVYDKDGKTYVTITTEEDVVLSEVYIIIDEKRVQLKETSQGNRDKKTDGTISYTRTLCFEGSGDKLTLEVKGIKYNKIYNKAIDIYK